MWRRLARWWLGPSLHQWSSWEVITLHGTLLWQERRLQQRHCLVCGFTQEQPIERAWRDEHVDFSILERP